MKIVLLVGVMLLLTSCNTKTKYNKVFFNNKIISFPALLNSGWNYKINEKDNFIISSSKTTWTLYVDYRQTENETSQYLDSCLEKIINKYLKEKEIVEFFIKPIQFEKWIGKLCVIKNRSQYYLLHNGKYCLILGMGHPAVVKKSDVIHFINSIDHIEPIITTLNNINIVRFNKFDFLWEFRLDNNCRFKLNDDFVYLWNEKNNKIYARIIPVQEEQYQNYTENILKSLGEEFQEKYVFFEKKHIGIWDVLKYSTNEKKAECWFALNNGFCICIISRTTNKKNEKMITEFIESLKYTQ